MKLRFFFALLFCSVAGWAQENFGEVTVTKSYYFGINLIPSINGDIYHFAELEEVGENKYKYNWLTRQEFILKASGLVPSKANPDGLDLFQKYNIKTDNPYWDPIANLWRLRFEGHPLDPRDNSGWFIPNPRYTIPDSTIYKNGVVFDTYLKGRKDSLLIAYANQRKLLAEFGIQKFSDFVIGEKVFKMIKSVQNKTWIEDYINKKTPKYIAQRLNGERPTYQSQTMEQRRKEMQVHNPYEDVTIRKVQRSGLDQLLHGVRGKKKKKNPAN